MARTHVSVLEVCVSQAIKRYGMAKGGRVGGRQAAFVHEWAMYQRDTGDDPGNASAFAAWGNLNRDTAYRRLAEFQELFAEFPDHDTPAPLAQHVRLKPAKRGRRSGASVPA